MPEHGGKLRDAATQYGIPLEQWVDLSTGINPVPWPVPEIPQQAWTRLPEENDGLLEIVRDYYQCESLLPVAGSQMAIQALPRLRTEAKVGMLHPSYNEHQHHWMLQGHEVISLTPNDIEEHLDQLDVLLLVNPNNPTANLFSVEQLLAWHQQLQSKGGWLIVDEAFIDTDAEQSLCKHSHLPGLIVLRSFGKFFGLAGIRLGFVCAEPQLLKQLSELIGPWVVSGPARSIAKQALADSYWHAATKKRLAQDSQRLKTLLAGHGLQVTGDTPLFCWIKSSTAEALHQQLAKQGIFTRLFHDPLSIRFGLPKDESEWQRLEQALSQIVTHDQEMVI